MDTFYAKLTACLEVTSTDGGREVRPTSLSGALNLEIWSIVICEKALHIGAILLILEEVLDLQVNDYCDSYLE